MTPDTKSSVYTGGPLSVLVDRGGAVYVVFAGDDKERDPVARLILSGRDSRDLLEYARAFAAAPEMMETLTSAVIALRNLQHKYGVTPLIKEIEQVLAKARFGV
jgi:hypothetical protein